MEIQTNTMNPVPLWQTKDSWYCKKVTNHGARSAPVLPVGMIPKMCLTVNGTMPTVTRSFELTDISGTPSLFTGEYEGNIPVSMTLGATFRKGVTFPEMQITQQGKICHVQLITSYIVGNTYDVSLFENEISTKDIPTSILTEGGHTFRIVYEGTGRTFSLSEIDLSYYISSSVSVAVKKVRDDATVATVTEGYEIVGAGDYYNNTRKGCMWIGGNSVSGTFAEGTYYLQFTLDNVTYFSEPFTWLANLSRYTAATYRRSEPVVTTDNVMIFTVNGTARSLEMWLPGMELMPPFKFTSDVTEIDGRKYATKQVSYHSDKCQFMCTDYFAEAVRLLWHCDIRTVNSRRVDYMEPPEVDWSADNHLCKVVLEFESDTVVQTNGTASAYGNSSDYEHTSYDASFDASFQ